MKYSKINRDRNHSVIVDALLMAGCSVLDLAMVGDSCPDILVGFRNDQGRYNILMEIKSSTKAQIKPGQVDFRNNWKGLTTVVRTADEALMIVESLREK